MAPSLWQILIVVVLLVLLFGRGKISALMGDVAKGIKSFKRGMAEDETAAPEPARVEHGPAHGQAHVRDGAIDVTPEANKDRA
ncbi:MAG TPA: twin-arginine translocase TatA/TatE family subunit [Alphaproteobacteria bacterium]